jgi:hypothetical protein
MVEALELAVVLVQAVVPRREAARREGQRQLAEGEDLGFHAGRTRPVQGLDHAAGDFQRRQPAPGALRGEEGQRVLVVDVEVRPGDDAQALVLRHLDRTEVVGLDQAAGIGHQPAHGLEVAFRFEQGLGGEHDFLAGFAQVLRQADPVRGAQLLAARADRLAQVDAVDRGMLSRAGVELHDLGLGPEEQQGAERDLHQRHGLL